MTSTKPEPVKEEEPAPAAATDESPVLKSVSGLRTLSFAISTFSRRFQELQKHLDSIQNSIEQRFKQLHPNQQQHVQVQDPNPTTIPVSVLDSVPDSVDSLPPDQVQDPSSEIERLCQTMSGRGLRKYVTSHLSDVDKLRDEVPKALKCAPEPVRLVLDCIGGFYLQGGKAYITDSPMIPARQACILILEFFLASGCSKVDPSVKEETEKAAITWRARLVKEGGIAIASDADALGLLLFVVAFGIPSEFGGNDLYELIRLSNVGKKASAFRRSADLVERIEDIIQWMLNNGMSVAAVGLACAFKLEEKFSPLSLLDSFVKVANQSGVEMRREGQCSYASLKEASEKQVAALKLVLKCVEDHKLNCAEVDSWKIDQKIAKLEKEIAKFEKKKTDRNLKRKAEELRFSTQAKTREHRQPTTIKASSLRTPPAAIPSQENKLYDGLLPKAMFDGGFPGLLNGLSDASLRSGAALSDGRSMGLLPGYAAGAFAGLGIPAGADPSIDSLRLSTGNGVGVFAGIGSGLSLANYAGTSTNDMVRSYGWHEERAVNNNSAGQSLFGLPSSAGQSFMGLSAPMANELSFPSHQGQTSNLYQFADTVLQRESYYESSHKGNAAPVYPRSHF